MFHLSIHVAEGFPILSLSLITEPLRVANREIGKPVFGWRIVSDQGGICRSSSGIPLETEPLTDEAVDAAILLASYQPDRSSSKATLAWLRRLDRRGTLLGCVDTGALVFAKAGLLERRPAATHPEAIAGFHRQFPKSLFVDRMSDFSPPRFSSAGGVATIDMTLALIGHVLSSKVARRVAQILTYEPPLSDGAPKPLPASVPREVRDAVALVQSDLSRRVRVADIARTLDLPMWKLNRLFNTYLHAAPRSYFTKLRLTKARDMLRNTTLPVGEIATACGYDNADAFSRAYRDAFGSAPSKDRLL